MKEYFLLETKMLIRNKQTKNLLLVSLILNLISIVAINSIMDSKAPLVFKLTILLFSVGYFFVFNYGRSLLSWEYYYLKDIFVKEINIKNYIYSKILLMQIYALLVFSLNLISIYLFQTEHLLLIVSLSFFLIGAGVYVLAFLSIYSVQPIKSNSGVLSSGRQKLLPIHIIGASILYFFPILLFSLFNNNYYHTSVVVLLIIGVIGLLLTKNWVKILAKIIVKNKYKILN